MQTIKLKDIGKEVTTLQQLLNSCGYQVAVTGLFGTKTDEALRNFQESKNLKADGIAGPKTWAALQKDKAVEMTVLKVTENDFQLAAQKINVEVAAVKAVQKVETNGKGGFLNIDHPALLFEGHIFWKQLIRFGLSPYNYLKGNEDILYPKWTKDFYKGGLGEYDRLERAEKIHEEAALSSASWGMFQIMGFNYKNCACKTVKEFIESMYANEGKQLELFVRFIKGNGWDNLLRDHNWADFALRYNGPDYAKNKYDKKLQSAYAKYV